MAHQRFIQDRVPPTRKLGDELLLKPAGGKLREQCQVVNLAATARAAAGAAADSSTGNGDGVVGDDGTGGRLDPAGV